MAYNTWNLRGRRTHGLIKRVQRGIVTITAGATFAFTTILTCDPDNSLVRLIGWTPAGGGSQTEPMMECYIQLAAASVTAAQNTASIGVTDLIAAFEVIEYWPGVIRSVQRGFVTSGTSATLATPVDATRATCDHLGRISTNAGFNISDYTYLTLNANGLAIASAGGLGTDAYQVVEWY